MNELREAKKSPEVKPWGRAVEAAGGIPANADVAWRFFQSWLWRGAAFARTVSIGFLEGAEEALADAEDAWTEAERALTGRECSSADRECCTTDSECSSAD